MARKDQFGRWPWVVAGILAGLAVLAGLAWAVWKLPTLIYGDLTTASPDARLQAASGFRTALVAGLAGLAALGSLGMATRTYRLTQQGQLTDRYTKAIEQLGNDKRDVRLGGIYALERIAVDSKRDHPTVVEVLGAFVREHSQPSTPPSDDDANGAPTPPAPRLAPPTDVQAAVTVLGRLPPRRDVSRGDLDGAHLQGANLQRANLQRANLRGANLRGANLRGANLQGAELQRTDLRGAELQRADLRGAELRGAELRGAELWWADLRWADLRGANLQGANLQGANLQGAELQGEELQRTDLRGAELRGADLRGRTWRP